MSATATPAAGGAVRATAPDARRRPRPLALAGWAALGVLALLVLLAAFFNLQWATHMAWDSHSLLQIAYRSIESGGSYYVAGADLKGPLWIAPYDLALRVANFYTVFWVLGAMLIAMGLATALLVYRIATHAGPSRWPAAGVATALAIWLFLGPEEYRQTLYSRNWLALLFAASVAAITALPYVEGRRRLVLAALAGATAGVAVQTNASSAPTALLMFLAVAWLTLLGPLRDSPRTARVPHVLAAFGGAAVLGFASVFAWYALRGDLGEFWWYWWKGGRDYAAGTDAGLVDILRKGWDDFVVYYRARPLIPLVVLLFACDAVRRRRLGESTWLDVLLVLWFLSECLVVALSQRFFPHYLVLPLVPVAAMAAVMAARWGDRLPVAARYAAPAFLGFCALWFGNWAAFKDGLHRLEHFESTAQTNRDNIAGLQPDIQQARTVVHTYVPNGAWAIVWTQEPFDYTNLDLRSAIRFVPRTWLTGEQPGAAAPSEDFVRPGSWDRFWSDVRRTPPQVIVYHTADPPRKTRPIGQLASCAFKPAWATDQWTVLLRTKKRFEQCLPRA
jgi:hypothetical protein